LQAGGAGASACNRRFTPSAEYMTSIKAAEVSGRDFYAGHYQHHLERQAKWLEYGAIEKTNSISQFIQRNNIAPSSLLELGCGTGAVILECERRGLALKFTAVDYSAEAIEYLKSRAPTINCLTADITDAGFVLKDRFDVIVLSHVLEHLEEPLPFLRAIRERFRFQYLIVEVPLEDLLIARVKSLFVDRNQHAAGHVQFFTGTAIHKLLRSAGFKIVDRRRFVPRMSRESIRFACENDKCSKLRTAYKLCTACNLPRLLGPIWKQVWYAHHAVLCAVDQKFPV
jgi:2-polyprenyl-3-methyl-5-hydroxy-6-metoxy-1,4-benzoquinol methylase